MEFTEQQQKEQASALIMELINHAINRGVFSSIECHAIKQAIEVINTPIVEEEKPKK